MVAEPHTDTSDATRRLAGWSTALGVAAILTAVVGIGVLLALLSIGLGVIALSRLQPWRPHDGHNLALSGIILGFVALLAFPVLLATAVPHLVTAYRSHEARLCARNLQDIQSAKQAWAGQHHLSNGTPVRLPHLYPTPAQPPHCPAGGRYRINPVGTPPECSIITHNEPPAEPN